MSKEAMKLALEALKMAWDDEECSTSTHIAVKGGIKALEEALTKQEQGEPVAYVNGDALDNMLDDRLAFIQRTKSGYRAKPLYTTPQQQRKPLTHEQRFDLLIAFEPHKNKWEAPAILIDMVEAAHGIIKE